MRAKIEKALRINETGEIGPLAIDALIAAYDRGAEWLDALNEYLHANYLFLREYFAQHLPQYPVLPLEGTYLVWADCRAAGLASDELAVWRYLRRQSAACQNLSFPPRIFAGT